MAGPGRFQRTERAVTRSPDYKFRRNRALCDGPARREGSSEKPLPSWLLRVSDFFCLVGGPRIWYKYPSDVSFAGTFNLDKYSRRPAAPPKLTGRRFLFTEPFAFGSPRSSEPSNTSHAFLSRLPCP